jgi:hypothetical protein
MFRKGKILSILVCFCLLFEQAGFAQVAGSLDISGYLAGLRNSFTQDKFRPLHLRSLGYDNAQNNFRLLLDKGDLKNPKKTELEANTKTLLNYFFIGITLPNDSFWVNLRPDSEDNIIDPYLATTDLGKIILEADLQLKKDTALATSPDTPEGKKYWDKLYKKAEEIFGYENITIPTLTRPWIVPGEIIIRETRDNAYIYKATLKVMLEQDYLKDSANYSFKDPRLKALNEYSSQLIRELIIPKLTKAVNTSQKYASLRQVYYSLILAQWFKQRFYGKGGLYSWLIDKRNLQGLTSKARWSKTTYFKAYQESFKDGEYNIQQPISTPYGQTIRSYFSGGFVCKLPTWPSPVSGAATPVKDGLTKVIPLSGDQRHGPLPQERPIAALVVGSTTIDPSQTKVTIIEEASSPSGLPAGGSQSGASSVSPTATNTEETQVTAKQASSPNLGAQVSDVKHLDRLLRLLNVLRRSENVPEVPESASDRDVMEFCIKYLQAKGLITTTTDEEGNVIITINNNALNHPDETVRRFVEAIQRWVINPEGGVRAVNFQGKDGIWMIVGFESELQNKDTLEHEQQEIKFRKQGLSWTEAHNQAVAEIGKGQRINREEAAKRKAGRQDEIGAAVDTETAVPFTKLVSALRNHIGKTGSSFYENMKKRIQDGEQPVTDRDKIGNVGQVNTLGTFIDEHFALPEEAVREIITNAYDSMHGESAPEQREVQVKLDDKFLSVTDSGSGMSLDTILKKLLPPFEGGKSSDILSQLKNILDDRKSEKALRIRQFIAAIDTATLSDTERLTINDIQRRLEDESIDEAQRLNIIKNIVTFTGRFGIGFYSLLYFLKTDEDSIEVVTSTGTEAHRIQFFRRNGELQTAIKVLNPSGLNRGTTVILKSQSFNKNNAQEVVNQFLRFNANAKISVSIDGMAPTVINEEVFNPRKFERISDDTQVETFYSREKNTSGKTTVYINVHGVTIMTKEVDGFGMPETVVFNFPANIGLPISRNKVLVNEIFIEKAKDMIRLIASKPELLSAFFPCIEVLESSAKASYRNILANAGADAAYNSWRGSGLVYLPNEQEYSKIKHSGVVLVDRRLLRMVFLRGFANYYSLIGEPLIFASGEEVVIGNKHVYLVDFVDETKFVAASDAILINRKHVPKVDTDKALYNVLLKLSKEGRFGYVYQPQALAATGAGQELTSESGESRTHISVEEIERKVKDILDSLPDERSKSHFQNIVSNIRSRSEPPWSLYSSDFLSVYIDNPTFFLTAYNLLIQSGLINVGYEIDFYRHLSSARILDKKDELQIIFGNERVKQLQQYFAEKDRPKLIIDLLGALMGVNWRKNLSELAQRKMIERLWEVRELLNELEQQIRFRGFISGMGLSFVVSCALLDEDTYKKFRERLTAEIDQAYKLDYKSYSILNSSEGLGLFIEGGFAATERIADISRRLEEAFGRVHSGYSTLALSMRNMSDDEIKKFIAVGKEDRKFGVSYSINPILPQYLRFLYGEDWVARFGSYFDNTSNRSELNTLEDIMKSGLPIQEKKRLTEAIIQAEEMFHDYRRPRSSSGQYRIDIESYISDSPGLPFDFTPDDLAQINNPALLIWLAYNVRPFNEDFLHKKYSLERQGEDIPFGYRYELRYKKELLHKIIIIFRHISNLPNDEFYAICSDFKEYFSHGKMTGRIEPYIQYLLNSQDAVDIKDKELDVQPQRQFTLVELYDTFLELSPEEEAQEESAGVKGDFNGVDRRIGKVAQKSEEKQEAAEKTGQREFRSPLQSLVIWGRGVLGRKQTSEIPTQQLTEERRKLLRNTFRAAAQQSVDDLVMIREVVQNVIDETPADAENQRVSINTYRKTLKTSEGEQELTVIDIEDTIGMNAERLFNKLLMPFSSSKKDPDKFLGKQGQGFFTLLANSEYVVIKTVRDGKVCILKLTPGRQNGQVVDFQVEEQRRDALAGENNGTRIQAFIKSALPGLEAARVSLAGQKFAALVDSKRLAVEVNGRQINLNRDRRFAVERSRYGEVEFYSMPGESFIALGGLFVKPIDDELLALVPPALRSILLQHGFAINLPFQKIKRIQGGSDIANREEVYDGVKDAVALGAMKLVIAMFARGELPSLGLLGDDYYDWVYDRQAVRDAQKLMDGSADIDRIRAKYFSSDSTNQLAKLLLAIPLDFLRDIFGRSISLAELFEKFKTDRQFFNDSVIAKLPQPIKDVFKAIEEKERKKESQQETAKELGVPEQLIGSEFVTLPGQQGEGMAAYWAFLEMSDAIARIGIEAMLQENSAETLGSLRERLEYLRNNPTRSHYYAEANGLSVAHAQQGGSDYAWNLLEQRENLKLFYQYLSKQISLTEFLDRAFENVIETLSHELIHILEESAEGTHNDVFLKRQKLMVSAMIGARNRIATVLVDIGDNAQYANNLQDVQIKDFLDYVVRSRTEIPVSTTQVVIPTDMEPALSNPSTTSPPVFGQTEKSTSAQKKNAEELSPFGKAGLDKERKPRFAAKVGSDGEIHLDFGEKDSPEFKDWNIRHENLHKEFDRRYPDVSPAAREIVAIALAFSEMSEIKDEHLIALLRVLNQMPGKVPSVTDREFLRQIALFLVEVNPFLRSKILDSKGEIMPEIISEAENIALVYVSFFGQGIKGDSKKKEEGGRVGDGGEGFTKEGGSRPSNDESSLDRNEVSSSTTQDKFVAPQTPKGQADKKGGIDFRALPIVNQQINMGILKLSPADLNRLGNINLDSEWTEIQNMVNAGIIPSNERIKEYVLASCLRQNLGNQMNKVLGCIADIMRMEEDRVVDADVELKDMLVLIEAGKPETELQCGLSQIKISPQEPKLVVP